MIYFIKAQSNVKIGYAADPLKRLKELQTGNPYKLKLVATMPGCFKTESAIHEVYKKYKRTGEWFKYDGALKWAIVAITDIGNPYPVIDIRSLQQAGLHLQCRQQANRHTKKAAKVRKKIKIIKGNL